MRTPLPFRRIAAALCIAATLTAAGCTVTTTPTTPPGPDAGRARQQLDSLQVAPARSMAGYSRDRFPHWSAQGDRCNTREIVLRRDGVGVRTDDECRAVSGTWHSPYDGREVTDAADVDIDHMVPLANAWRSGADVWSDDERAEFANDLTRPQLIAVTASSNRAKGDQNPAQWKPPNRGFWCEYGQRWTAVKAHWRLTVTEAEKATLIDMLATCGSQTAPARGNAAPTSSPVRAG